MFINSARELADGLSRRLNLGLTARPWNLYSPSDTFWWLVPSTEWPAYRYGKLAFSQAKDVPRRDLLGTAHPTLETDKLFAGFNVEKGYGAAAAFVNPMLKRKSTQIMDPGWLWHEVTGESGAERFARTLRSGAEKRPLYLYVVAGYVHDRESAGAVPHDALMFACKDSGLVAVTDNGSPINQLTQAARAETFPALAAHLAKIDDYHWVDLYAGTHVSPGDVDLAMLHDQLTSFFEPWLR